MSWIEEAADAMGALLRATRGQQGGPQPTTVETTGTMGRTTTRGDAIVMTFSITPEPQVCYCDGVAMHRQSSRTRRFMLIEFHPNDDGICFTQELAIDPAPTVAPPADPWRPGD